MRKLTPAAVMVIGRVATAVLLAAAILQPDSSRHVALTALIESGEESARTALRADVRALNQQLIFSEQTFGDSMSLEDAFDRAVWSMETRHRNAVVIVSDGNRVPAANLGLRRASDAGLQIFWQPVDLDVDNLRILSINAPRHAQPGQTAAIHVETVAPDDGDFELLLYGNGELMARKRREAQTIMTFTMPSPGSVTLALEARNLATQAVAARLDAAAIVNIVAPPHVLIVSSRASPIATSLRAGGWPVTRLAPREFPAYANRLFQYTALVLDDVAATALNEPDWQAISLAVQQQALGLLVLGGPNAFAAGAYRESTLETVLPVISEPPDSVQPAAVAFVVDVSGSMDRGAQAAFSVAEAAVSETASGLRPSDRVGLISFDVTADLLLPVAARPDHVAAIRAAWPDGASGGTRLMPAIDQALRALDRDSTEQKLIVLVTDGMLANADIADLRDRIADQDVDLIVLAIQSAPSSAPLAQIRTDDNIRLLVVDDVLRLPSLMRSEVASKRPAIVRQRTEPQGIYTATDVSMRWPALDAYALTRPKPAAHIELRSPNGDPLMATWTIGAGRVTVLTGGLNDWARTWIDWDEWPSFVASLMTSIAIGSSERIAFESSNDGRSFSGILIDVEADIDDVRRATLISPTGIESELDIEAVAPGQIRARLPDIGLGEHTFVFDSADRTFRQRFVAGVPTSAGTGRGLSAAELTANGTIMLWSSDTARQLIAKPSSKGLLIAFALLTLLLTIVAERAPLRQWLRLESIAQREPGAAAG